MAEEYSNALMAGISLFSNIPSSGWRSESVKSWEWKLEPKCYYHHPPST